MLGKISKFLIRKGPYIALGALLFYVLTKTAFAGNETADAVANTEQSLGFLISIAMKMLNTFLWPFLLVIGELMDSDLIIGPGMEERLLGIWVQVRNLVNIGFVVMLLIIAMYNVVGVGGGEGNLALKTALPKLVLGLILVNFTFLGGKVLIDVSNVATTAAFALPEVVDDFDFANTTAEFSKRVCKKEDGTLWGEEEKGLPISTQLFCELKDKEYTGNLNELMEATYFKQLNANNVGIVMAVNMGALESLALLKPEAIKDFSDLLINGLFSVVMYVLFAASYITLGLVLLARIVVLWVALALSPVIVLFYVVPQIKEAAGSNLDIMEKVTKHLLAPIIIGVVLTIGFLMISAMAGLGDSFQEFAKAESGEMMAADFLISGVEDMEKFIIAIATIMIIWTGVFAAAEGTYASVATNYIKGLGEKVGTALAKAPLYATSIPIVTRDGTKSTSPMAALGLLNKGLDAVNYGSDQGAKDLGEKILPPGVYNKIFGNDISTDPKENERSMMSALNNMSVPVSTIQNVADRMMNDVKRSDMSMSDKSGLESQIKAIRGQLADPKRRGAAQRQLADIAKEKGKEIGYSDPDALDCKIRAANITDEPAPPPPAADAPAPAEEDDGVEAAGTASTSAAPAPPPAATPTPINFKDLTIDWNAAGVGSPTATELAINIDDLRVMSSAEIASKLSIIPDQAEVIAKAVADQIEAEGTPE